MLTSAGDHFFRLLIINLFEVICQQQAASNNILIVKRTILFEMMGGCALDNFLFCSLPFLVRLL